MRKIKHVLRHTVTRIVLGAALTSGCMAPGGARPPQDDDAPTKPAPTDARTGLVRAMHLARTAPPLRLTHDEGQPMVDAIAFAGMTDRLPMDIGEHGFDVFRVDNGDPMASVDELSLSEGERWSLIVWGSPTEMHASMVADALQDGYRIINALPGGAQIRAHMNDDASARYAPGESSDVVGSGGGDTLSVDTDGDGTDDATYTLPSDDGDDASTDLFFVQNEGGGGVSLYACTPSGLAEVPANEALPNARLRALHLSPNAPAVDVFLNGALGLSGLTFPNSSGYAELPADTYDIDVAPQGAGIDNAVLSVDGLALGAARAYTAVAYGALPNIRALALEDDESPVGPGNIRVRAAHTADGVGQVDVLAIGATNTIVYDDVDFGAVSDFIEIPAAAITLGLDLDDDLTPEFTFAVPQLPVGTIATLFAVLGADGPFLFAATQNGAANIPGIAYMPPPPANVRVVHLSPDAPAVSVSANDERIVDSVSFYGATDFVAVDAGTTDLDIALAASPDAPILSVTGAELAADSYTTAVAFGSASNLQVLALAEDRTPPAAGNIRVRPVHTAVGVGTVDIYVVTSSGHVKIVDDLSFGVAADALEVPAGAYTLALDINQDATPDLTFHLPHLAEGTIGNIFAVTDNEGNASLAIQH